MACTENSSLLLLLLLFSPFPVSVHPSSLTRMYLSSFQFSVLTLMSASPPVLCLLEALRCSSVVFPGWPRVTPGSQNGTGTGRRSQEGEERWGKVKESIQPRNPYLRPKRRRRRRRSCGERGLGMDTRPCSEWVATCSECKSTMGGREGDLRSRRK